MSNHVDAFHAHLTVCARCMNQPMNLCEAGARLLKEAADETAEELTAPYRIVNDIIDRGTYK